MSSPLKCNSYCFPEEDCVADLNSIISKVEFPQFIAYLKTNCYKALFGFDQNGSTPMHAAAKCGKAEILEWIILELKAQQNNLKHKLNVNTKDLESGWTPLHKAVYYGRTNCVAALLRNGANINIQDWGRSDVIDFINWDISPWRVRDSNGFGISDSIINLRENGYKPTSERCNLNKASQSEVYAWGVNENLSLGTKTNKDYPTPLEFFNSKGIYIEKVVLCKYHSLFLAQNGLLYTCGHGQGGRLGSGYEDFVIEPRLVKCSGGNITHISAATDHTAVITHNSILMTCGRNHARVLGITPPPDSQLTLSRVMLPKQHLPIGCAAGNFHTAVWTNKLALFTFGTNAGQLGHAKGDTFVIQPRQVSSVYSQKDPISDVQVSDAATVVFTKTGSVFLLTSFTCKRILSNHLDVKKLCVGGGLLDVSILSQVRSGNESAYQMQAKKSNRIKEVRILILKNTGEVYSWRSDHSTIDACKFTQYRTPDILDIEMSKSGTTVALVSEFGRVFVGSYGNLYSKKKKATSGGVKEYSSSSSFLDADSIQYFRVDPLLNSNRTHTVSFGPKGRNGVLLQTIPETFLTKIPCIQPMNDYKSSLTSLYNDQSAVSDHISDVTIHVKSRGIIRKTYNLHWYILISRSSLLSQLFNRKQKLSITSNVIIVQGVGDDVMDALVRVIYGDSSPTTTTGGGVDRDAKLFIQDHESTTSQSLTKQQQRSASGLVRMMKIFGVDEMTSSTWSHDPLLHDCVVCCEDGVVFDAHRCILAARVPYFAAMLSPWSSCMIPTPSYATNGGAGDATTTTPSSGCNLKVSTTSDIFTYIFDFIYSDSVDSFNKIDGNIILLLEILACADQLLFDRCKQAVETKIVSLISVKNVIEVSEIAQTFNSDQLYQLCVEFSCQNISYLLHTTNFLYANDDFLADMQCYYRSRIPNVHNRAAPPCSWGPTVDDIPPEALCDVIDCDLFSANLNLSGTTTATNGNDMKQPNNSGGDSLKRKRRRKKSSRNQQRGFLLSDVLDADDQDDDVIKKIIAKPDDVTVVVDDVITPTSPTPPIKMTSLPSTTVKSSTPSSSVVTSSSKPTPPVTSSSVSGKISTPAVTTPMPKKPVVVRAAATAKPSNYANHFPSLGGAPPPTCLPTVAVSNNGKPPAAVTSPTVVMATTPTTVVKGGKYKKMSQKQKKRMMMEAADSERSRNVDVPIPSTPTANVWGVSPVSPPVVSPFATSPPENRNVHFSTSPLKSPSSRPQFPSMKSPKNIESGGPWKHLGTSPPTPHHPPTPSSPPVVVGRRQRCDSEMMTSQQQESLHDIMLTEKEENDEEKRLKKKPLSVIQMEEEAMNELRQHYLSQLKCKSTKITVSRVTRLKSKQLLMEASTSTTTTSQS